MMPKPSVLVIAPTPYFSDRGCHIRIFEELKLIAALGYQSHLVTYPLGRSTGAAQISRTVRLPWYHKTSAGPAWSKLILDSLLLLKSWSIIRKEKPVLIHAHLHESFWIAWLLRLFFKIPIILDLQSVLSAEFKSYGGIWKLLAPLTSWYEGWAVKSANIVFVSADKAFQQLHELYPKQNFTLLRDGVGNTVALKPIQYDVVYSGGLGNYKGTDQLFAALELVKLQQPDIRILLITPGHNALPYEQLLPTLATCRLGIEPKPPTTTEGSGKLLNYMAAGVEPIYFASDTNAALTGQRGYAVNDFTAQALADTIVQALQTTTSEEQRRTLQRYVQEHHQWSLQMNVLQSAYDRALRTA